MFFRDILLCYVVLNFTSQPSLASFVCKPPLVIDSNLYFHGITGAYDSLGTLASLLGITYVNT